MAVRINKTKLRKHDNLKQWQLKYRISKMLRICLDLNNVYVSFVHYIDFILVKVNKTKVIYFSSKKYKVFVAFST